MIWSKWLGMVLLLLLLPAWVAGQTNIDGILADSQIWITWEKTGLDPETYAVYRSETAFIDTSQAELIGRLYPSEWDATAIRDQLAELGYPFTNWVIPAAGAGTTTLGLSEALFVDTVDEGPNGTRWYAVVKWGETTVTPGVNLIQVPWVYSPADPPRCHVQFEDTLGSGHPMRVYAMWAHGQDDYGNGRPDFPVMGNRHKNGMPSMFMLFESLSLGPPPYPVTYWLHGGGGEALNTLPLGRPRIDAEPNLGLLVSHNDDFQRPKPDPITGEWSLSPYSASNTWWFGYPLGYDPFAARFHPANDDTIINYTQRRLVWIHQWLVENEDVDPERTALQGHSMGAAGTTHMAKTFPNLFSTATIFNNGFLGPNEFSELFGRRDQDLPTNLQRAGGQVVRAYDLFDLTTPTSPERDLPLIRMFHGKNDCCGAMTWDADVVAEYRAADALGIGAHLYWDLREHGWSGILGYWTEGGGDAFQTGRDDVARQELHRVHRSYPAFFNHQQDKRNPDPGDGSQGSASGDDEGTWGGYHAWNPNTIIDTPDAWQVVVYLTGLSPDHPRDNCPVASLVSDVAVRKPQQFLPPPGSLVRWSVLGPGPRVLQRGQTTLGTDGLVIARGIVVTRDPDRRVLRFERVPTVGERDDP